MTRVGWTIPATSRSRRPRRLEPWWPRDKHDVIQRIKAGRIWQRMHLWATTQGLAVQPLNQVVERAEREEAGGSAPEFAPALAALVPEPDREALMPFRIGYPTAEALASPRPSSSGG